MNTVIINNKTFYPYIDTRNSRIYLHNNVLVDHFTDEDAEFFSKFNKPELLGPKADVLPNVTGTMRLALENGETAVIDCTFFNCFVQEKSENHVIISYQGWTNRTMVKQEEPARNINV